MKAPSVIGNAPFGPETLKVLIRAYDAAWATAAANFGDEPSVIERARVRLAHALLSVASEDSRDAEVLKRAALVVMAGVHQDRVGKIS